eukprot:TRINITY_DN4458_c0_g1_i4.p1 TRINITY_DN4458_c0_g1~~TRINITY_DN4458_c0_g1_i4.p1  ORF type:complete len:585 (+),score=93.40 TRINITY_DN4458_c0_g1_i4:102-1856(+)
MGQQASTTIGTAPAAVPEAAGVAAPTAVAPSPAATPAAPPIAAPSTVSNPPMMATPVSTVTTASMAPASVVSTAVTMCTSEGEAMVPPAAVEDSAETPCKDHASTPPQAQVQTQAVLSPSRMEDLRPKALDLAVSEDNLVRQTRTNATDQSRCDAAGIGAEPSPMPFPYTPHSPAALNALGAWAQGAAPPVMWAETPQHYWPQTPLPPVQPAAWPHQAQQAAWPNAESMYVDQIAAQMARQQMEVAQKQQQQQQQQQQLQQQQFQQQQQQMQQQQQLTVEQRKAMAQQALARQHAWAEQMRMQALQSQQGGPSPQQARATVPVAVPNPTVAPAQAPTPAPSVQSAATQAQEQPWPSADEVLRSRTRPTDIQAEEWPRARVPWSPPDTPQRIADFGSFARPASPTPKQGGLATVLFASPNRAKQKATEEQDDSTAIAAESGTSTRRRRGGRRRGGANRGAGRDDVDAASGGDRDEANHRSPSNQGGKASLDQEKHALSPKNKNSNPTSTPPISKDVPATRGGRSRGKFLPPAALANDTGASSKVSEEKAVREKQDDREQLSSVTAEEDATGASASRRRRRGGRRR